MAGHYILPVLEPEREPLFVIRGVGFTDIPDSRRRRKPLWIVLCRSIYIRFLSLKFVVEEKGDGSTSYNLSSVPGINQ